MPALAGLSSGWTQTLKLMILNKLFDQLHNCCWQNNQTCIGWTQFKPDSKPPTNDHE